MNPPASLVDRLASHEALTGIPRAELEWLATHGELQAFEAGEVMLAAGQPARELIIQFTGRVVVHFGNAPGRRHPMESRAGSITGVLPYSRLTSPPSDVVAVEPTEGLAVDRDQFPAMITACPVVTERLVHTMLDRARRFAAVDWQDEKLISLGRLAAALSHELNNPAAAAVSGAQHLSRSLVDVGEAAHALGTAALGAEQRRELDALMRRCLIPNTARQRDRSPIDRADHEDRISAWLDEHGVDSALAPALVDGGADADTLDALAQIITGPALEASLRWVATAAAAQTAASDVERAARRIHELVSAVRGFTYMDRALVTEPTDVGKGIADTIAVLAAKARARNATVRLELAPDLPAIPAVGAELNQVWSQLLDNALDAIDANGEVEVRAQCETGELVVSVTDNGPGVPDEISARVFDPFFTTKAVGSATGLGLHLAQRVVRAHGGELDFQSKPGRTAFRARIPLAGAS